MENDYNFRNTPDGLITVNEANTRITHTLLVERKLFGYRIRYERVLILKTARARVRYAIHNNPVARFKRTARSFIAKKLHVYGIDISRA